MRTAIISATMVCLVFVGQIAADHARAAAAETSSPATAAPDDQAQEAKGSGGAKEETVGLQEITVTATRRSERASDVPISVAAFDQQAMESLGVKDIEDINLVTPGLSYKPYFRGTSLVAIRGIYSNNGAATTGVYIDDTPVQNRLIGAGANATNIYPDVFDLERVEVLRGPQGTLFGASSEGGNIRFITAQPSLTDYSGHARSEISYTEYGAPSYEIGAAEGGPIVPDLLGFRVSAYSRDDGGWIDREPYPGTLVTDKNVNTTNTTVVNAAVTYAPTPNLTFTPSIFYQRIYQGDLPQYWRSLSDPSAGDYYTGLTIPESSTDKFSLPALKIQWNLNGATLFSNTSYLDRTRDNQADYSSVIVQVATGNYVTPGNIQAPLSPVYFQNPQKTFTQEVRLQSSDDNARVTWVTGLFYQAAKQDAGEFVYSPNAGILSQALYGKTVAQEYGEGLLPGGLFYAGVDTAHDDQKALFGQLDGKITDALTATLGVRVARLSSDFTNAATGAWNGGSSSGSGGVSESAVTPKYGLSYKLTPDWLVYTSASKGFRPGGGNPPVSGICAGDLAALGLKEAPSGYKSDSVWSYEVGTKGTPLNGRLNIDGSAYYIKWSGIQQEVPLQCGFGYTANDGEAISRGFDLHAAMSVFSNLILGMSVGYDDAYYTKTIPLPGSNQLNLVTAGDRLNTAPWKALGTIDYFFTPLADLHAYLHADYDYSNGYNYSTNGLTLGGPNDSSYDPLDHTVYAQRLASARLGVKLDSWDVSLFVKNLFDSHDLLYTTHQPVTSQLFEDQTFRPRTIGLTATLKF